MIRYKTVSCFKNTKYKVENRVKKALTSYFEND